MNTRSDDAELTDDTYDLSGLRIVNDQLRGFSFTEKRFSNCVFAGCDFTDADLAQAVFERCRFEDCNLSNPSIERAAFDSVVFDGCKLVGLQFRLVNQFAFAVAFHRSTLRACVFDGVRMQKTRVSDCELIDCSLIASDFRGTSFENTRFRGTRFEEVNLENASFRNASGYEIDPGRNRLRNALFSSPEVLALLHHLQIRIDEDDDG